MSRPRACPASTAPSSAGRDPSARPQRLRGRGSDDILLRFEVVDGALRARLAIPIGTARIGAPFCHQLVPIELDGAGHVLALAAKQHRRTDDRRAGIAAIDAPPPIA